LLNRVAAAHLKQRGTKAGMPDIFIWYLRKGQSDYDRCIGIELKRTGKYPSAAQKDVFYKLRKLGVNIWICRDIDDVRDVLHREGVPNREAHPDLDRDGTVPARSGERRTSTAIQSSSVSDRIPSDQRRVPDGAAT
jgi:hypothetical protein